MLLKLLGSWLHLLHLTKNILANVSILVDFIRDFNRRNGAFASGWTERNKTNTKKINLFYERKMVCFLDYFRFYFDSRKKLLKK